MNIQEISRLKKNFVVRTVGDELIIVPLTSNIASMNEMFVINEVGKLIWENLNENSSAEELTDKITSLFEIDEATASRDLNDFLARLEKILTR